MKKKIDHVKIYYKQNGKNFEFWLNDELKETDKSFINLMKKVNGYELSWDSSKNGTGPLTGDY